MSAEESKTPSEEKVAAAPAEELGNPHDLVHEVDVQIALHAAEGPDAMLDSFCLKDFTSKGDNYACVVSSVIVQYTKNEKNLQTTFVVKLNPCRGKNFNRFCKVIFVKETMFYTEMKQLLNNELDKVGEMKLLLPEHYHSVTKEAEEVIFLEDLRTSGYKMFDRKKGMDQVHTELILRELARFHAASVLLMSSDEYKGVDMIERFPYLGEPFDQMQEDSEMNMGDMIDKSVENSAKIVESICDYKKVSDYLRSIIGKSEKTFKDLLQSKAPYNVICHGDCWNNNFLFRYSDEGKPVECRLLDLQITRIGSPALDLNYMLYCSLGGEVRRDAMSSFLANYYASFASVLSAANRPMKFNLRQLKKEFHNKNLFGLIMGTMLIPIVLMDSEDAPSFTDFMEEDMAKAMEAFQAKILEVIQKNALLRPRFLDMFDEMDEAGVFDKKLTE